MPSMPRLNNKTRDIAWKILGKPDAFRDDPSPRIRRAKQVIDYMDTVRER